MKRQRRPPRFALVPASERRPGPAATEDDRAMSTMTTNDLARQIAEETGIDSGQTKLAVETVFEIIVRRVAAGDEVNVTSFGKFSLSERQARQDRNPATGEAMRIPASKGL